MKAGIPAITSSCNVRVWSLFESKGFHEAITPDLSQLALKCLEAFTRLAVVQVADEPLDLL